MKKTTVFFLFITILISFQCKKGDPIEPNIIVPPKIVAFHEIYSFEHYGFHEMKYKDNRFDYAVFSGDTIRFNYKNNRLDYYIGPMFGTCCDVRRRKQYHYFNDSLVDKIWFKSTYKDDELEDIELKYNGANQINYYRLYHSLDPYPYYVYEWENDDISKVTTYNFNYHVTPDLVVQSIDSITYSDIINPLQSLKTIYFKSIFLSKHLPISMIRIRYSYDCDYNNVPFTRTLTKIDTLHYDYSFDYSNSGLVTGIYMNNKKHFVIKYDK